MTEHSQPSEGEESGATPVTGITESDPNADSEDGLAGDMGISSERRGPVRGQDEPATHATAPTFVDEEAESPAPPEQSTD